MTAQCGGKGKPSRWPCTVCKEGCSTNAIFCQNCCQWSHYVRENLSEGNFQQLSKVSCGYVCTKCRVDQYGSFDFIESLQTLGKASRNMKALHHAATVENIYSEVTPFNRHARSNEFYQKKFTSIRSVWSTCMALGLGYPFTWKAMVTVFSTLFQSPCKVMKKWRAS